MLMTSCSDGIPATKRARYAWLVHLFELGIASRGSNCRIQQGQGSMPTSGEVKALYRAFLRAGKWVGSRRVCPRMHVLCESLKWCEIGVPPRRRAVP